MKVYVAGFLFGHEYDSYPFMKTEKVLLVRKLKPKWQAGYWNAIGGKVEDGEMPIEAMTREFKEETCINTSAGEWEHMVTLVGPGGNVFFFRTFVRVSALGDFPRKNDNGEEIDWQKIDSLPENTLTNLTWLVPFCAYQKLEHPIFVHEDMDDNKWQTPGKGQ